MPATLQATLNVLEAGALVPVAFVALMIVLVLRRRPRPSRFAAPVSPAARSPQGLGIASPQQQQVRQDVESLIVELDELARKINAQIDTRFAKLEAVIRDADRRIATLERLADQADQAAHRRPARPPAGDAQHAVVYELADAGKTPIEIARQLGRTPGEVELILNLRRPGIPAVPPPHDPPAKPAPKKRKSRRKNNTSSGSQDG